MAVKTALQALYFFFHMINSCSCWRGWLITEGNRGSQRNPILLSSLKSLPQIKQDTTLPILSHFSSLNASVLSLIYPTLWKNKNKNNYSLKTNFIDMTLASLTSPLAKQNPAAQLGLYHFFLTVFLIQNLVAYWTTCYHFQWKVYLVNAQCISKYSMYPFFPPTFIPFTLYCLLTDITWAASMIHLSQIFSSSLLYW